MEPAKAPGINPASGVVKPDTRHSTASRVAKHQAPTLRFSIMQELTQTPTSGHPDLATVLAMPNEPLPPPHMPPASLRIRVKTSPGLRRRLPTRLMVSRAVQRGQRTWERSPEVRQEAVAAMEAIVGATPRAHEITELARQSLIESEAAKALFWEPWATPHVDQQSAARLREVLSADRGVLFSACHLGPYTPSMSILKPLGHVPFVVAGPWFFEKPTPGLWGRRIAHWWKCSNARYICSRGSFPILKALLERGDLVYLFYDLPGPHQTRFLGKTAMLADGSARLATETDALVVPVRARRVRHRIWEDVGPALDPRQFAGVDQLHSALAEVHGRWILEHPEEMEDPRGFGWHATSAEWSRPKRPDRPE